MRAAQQELKREQKQQQQQQTDVVDKEEPTKEEILRWSRQAIKTWRLLVGTDCAPINASYHRCEGHGKLREKYDKMSDGERQAAYDLKLVKVHQFFETNFYRRPPPFAFFITQMAYSRQDMYVRCQAVLAERISMPTSEAAAMIRREFVESVKVDYIEEWRQLDFRVPYVESCNMIPLPFRVHILGDKRLHVCIPGVRCIVADHHHLRYANESDLWLCRGTGIMHLCGEFCSIKVPTNECYVCPLTGINSKLEPGAFEHRPQSRQYVDPKNLHWAPMRYKRFSRDRYSVTNVSADSMHMQQRIFGGTFSEMLEYDRSSMNDMYTKRSEIKSLRTLYELEAFKKVQAALSNHRLKTECERKMATSDHDIEFALNQYELREANARNPIDLLACITMITNLRAKRDNIILGTFDDATHQRISHIYAARCVVLWWLVLTRTSLGRDQPWLFIYEPFVIAALLIMAEGFSLEDPADHKGAHISLIEPEKVLAAFNIGTAIKLHKETYGTQTNTSHPNSRNPTSIYKEGQGIGVHQKRRISEHTITTMVKNIKHALTNAIRGENVPPSQLKLSGYTLQEVPNDLFRDQQKYQQNPSVAAANKIQEEVLKLSSAENSIALLHQTPGLLLEGGNKELMQQHADEVVLATKRKLEQKYRESKKRKR